MIKMSTVMIECGPESKGWLNLFGASLRCFFRLKKLSLRCRTTPFFSLKKVERSADEIADYLRQQEALPFFISGRRSMLKPGWITWHHFKVIKNMRKLWCFEGNSMKKHEKKWPKAGAMFFDWWNAGPAGWSGYLSVTWRSPLPHKKTNETCKSWTEAHQQKLQTGVKLRTCFLCGLLHLCKSTFFLSE